ncbi:MAG TPA: hypothetical protein VN048_18520 [Verrucomicrobiae bacterium]|jgi:hypothetical protein|nr:hypothetical protein [Verrucomicrobiae bacterium]
MNSEPALIPAILLSDMAIREMMTGKVSYIGSFQSFTVPAFPYPVAPFFVTPFVTNLSDVTTLSLTARIENPENGVVLASSAIGIAFGRPSKRNEIYEIPIPMGSIVFSAPFNYRVVILVNNEKIGDRELAVLSTTPPPQQQQ